jgi:hypothetical protein
MPKKKQFRSSLLSGAEMRARLADEHAFKKSNKQRRYVVAKPSAEAPAAVAAAIAGVWSQQSIEPPPTEEMDDVRNETIWNKFQ